MIVITFHFLAKGKECIIILLPLNFSSWSFLFVISVKSDDWSLFHFRENRNSSVIGKIGPYVMTFLCYNFEFPLVQHFLFSIFCLSQFWFKGDIAQHERSEEEKYTFSLWLPWMLEFIHTYPFILVLHIHPILMRVIFCLRSVNPLFMIGWILVCAILKCTCLYEVKISEILQFVKQNLSYFYKTEWVCSAEFEFVYETETVHPNDFDFINKLKIHSSKHYFR